MNNRYTSNQLFFIVLYFENYSLFFFLFKDNDCIVFYISFDPFSLIDQKFDVSFGEKSNNGAQRLKSMSIYNAISGSNISLESLYGGATSPPLSNIGDVFLFLKNHYQGQLVHFLVDELHQEVFTKSYASTLYNICLLYTSPSPRDRG